MFIAATNRELRHQNERAQQPDAVEALQLAEEEVFPNRVVASSGSTGSHGPAEANVLAGSSGSSAAGVAIVSAAGGREDEVEERRRAAMLARINGPVALTPPDAIEFAREQAAIKEASERRRQAREAAAEAMRRELDAEDSERQTGAEVAAEAARQERLSALDPEPEPEPAERKPPVDWAPSRQASTIQSLVAPDEGTTEELAALGSDLLELQQLQDSEWTTVGAKGAPGGWEVGSVQMGVVSFWNQGAGWGKIKRMAGAAKLHPKRPARKGWNQEIFVHNTQLPMDSRRRWLKRGEKVQFTVGVGAKGKGPQAMAVVGVGEDDVVGAPLLCQQQANPPAFKKGFLDGGGNKKKKKKRGGGLIGGGGGGSKRAD